jgi:hypothetical protein
MSETSEQIVVRKQVRLSFARTVEICGSGIYYRLFRSLVTVAIVSVAVAFMMYMLGGSLIGRAVNASARAEAARYKVYDRWLSWMDEPMAPRDLFRLMSRCPPGDPKIAAIGRWAGLAEAQTLDLAATARAAAKYLDFFAGLSPGKRFLLTEGAAEEDLLAWLLDDSGQRRFLDRLATVGGVKLPGSVEDFRAFLGAYRARVPALEAAAAGRDRAIAGLRERYPGRKASDLLAEPPPDLADTLRGLGFGNEGADLDPVVADARYDRDLRTVADLLRHAGFRREISKAAKVPPTAVSLAALSRVYLTGAGPALFEKTLAKCGLTVSCAPDRLRELLRGHLRRTRVLDIEAMTAGFEQSSFGFSRRTLWLICVSFVVCIVGIANAMLMSVMERFREIATMKCLGATDTFVMTLFVLESCLQGVVGGFLGALLGLLLSLPSAAMQYGALAWKALPGGEMAGAAGAAIGMGVILAAVASVYPAHVAARLVPMEAMRVE